MPNEAKRVYRFGPFLLDTGLRLLTRDGEILPITRKAFDTLSLLVENSGRVLQKDGMISRIWPDSYVEEATLAQNIFTIRKLLGESPIEPQYIETVPRLGYRFTAKVVEVLPDNPQQATGEKDDSSTFKSLAVLPFKVLTVKEGEEYFGLGMADALITILSNLDSITVRPTSAVLKYDRRDYDLCGAGVELKVQQVLSGIIQVAEDRIRVTVQLINVEDGKPLWADKFDEKFSDVFAVQDTISGRVVEALTLKLTHAQRQRLTRHYTKNSEAYRFYLKGRYFWSKWTAEGFKKGITFFERAIEMEPDYPLPYAGLADTYTSLGFYGHLQPYQAMPRVKAMARKALHLDNQLAEARLPLAAALFFYDWDWEGAEEEFKRTITANPSYAIAQQSYALFLIAMRRFDEAIARLKRASEDDPVSPLIKVTAGLPYYYTGRYDQAIEYYRETLEEEPYFGLAHAALGDVYVQKGMYEEAIHQYKEGLITWGEKSVLPYLIHAYALAGRAGDALESLRRLEQLSEQDYISPFSLAIAYTGLGHLDLAFEWLEKAYDERSNRLVFLNVLPIFAGLRSDDRFASILARIGLEA